MLNNQNCNQNSTSPHTATPFDDIVEQFFEHQTKNGSNSRLNKNNHKLIREKMESVYGRKTMLFCIDVEAWERSKNFITEIGISIYNPQNQEYSLSPNIETYHILVRENLKRRNGRYVPDNALHFSGEKTHVMSEDDARWAVLELFDSYFNKSEFPCALVGHDVRGDISWLRGFGVDVPKGMDILDTQKLFALTHGKNRLSLENCLRVIGQPFAFLHNAGNDAYYTIMLALKLCDPSVRMRLRFDWKEEDEDLNEVMNVPKRFGEECSTEGVDYETFMKATGCFEQNGLFGM